MDSDARSTGLTLLETAHDFVASGWSQGADARDADGREVDPWDDSARSWSLLGAIVAALEREAQERGELPLAYLAAALDALAVLVDDDSLAAWNDRPSRTRKDVLRVLVVAHEFYEDPWPVQLAARQN